MTPTRPWPAMAAIAVVVCAALAGCTGAPPGPTPTVPPISTAPAPGPSAAGVVTTVATDLVSPWSLVPLPDGGALVSQRDDGAIVEIGADGVTRRVGTVPGVVPGGEAGLNGIALWHGDGGTWLYAYHAASDDNRVVRMPLLGAPGTYRLGAAETVLRGIRKAQFHNGGRLAFGPDGMLYVTTGDAGDPADAQDRHSLNGKILRLTPEGDPAPGNPFGTAVYSYGHRNVQGIAWTPDGTMWASEFGQNTWDELNVIVPGGDYGWPVVEGIAHDSRFRDPVLQWPTDQASPSGLAARGNDLYLACLRGERLWQVTTDGDRVVGGPVSLLADNGRLRDVAVANDWSLWVLTDNTDGRGSPRPGDDRVLRVAAPG
ncbi:PQQ-dependent sugar dehydrogenase [Microbacterium luticocti]|uniref:PQQ-dependent sugar dehydrogenase n=1 Tax=Microbacterium luticocti TaxID=451764 RepID=UPI000409CDB1|nr:PQQ-dependent sugar dehydrogenase [Microbacterium luticocti]